jgi:hypothetical protein
MAPNCRFVLVCESLLLIGYFVKLEETPETYPCGLTRALPAMVHRLELVSVSSCDRLVRLRLKRLACSCPVNATLTEDIKSLA